MQMTAKQMKAILYIEWWIRKYRRDGKEDLASDLQTFVSRWLILKQNNNSDLFVMKALEHISLRKFINENTMKVNIEK